MKSWLTFLALFVASCLTLVLCLPSAYARDPNSPEVQALVGVIIPPVIKNEKRRLVGGEIVTEARTASGSLPGFQSVLGAALPTKTKVRTGLDVGFFGATPVFILSRQYSDMSEEVLDVQTLPKAVLEMQLKGSEITYIDDGYRFSDICRTKPVPSDEVQWIFGLVKPENGKEDCAHYSRRVLKSWHVDADSGKIKEIPPKKLQCFYVTMDDCN